MILVLLFYIVPITRTACRTDRSVFLPSNLRPAPSPRASLNQSERLTWCVPAGALQLMRLNDVKKCLCDTVGDESFAACTLALSEIPSACLARCLKLTAPAPREKLFSPSRKVNRHEVIRALRERTSMFVAERKRERERDVPCSFNLSTGSRPDLKLYVSCRAVRCS